MKTATVAYIRESKVENHLCTRAKELPDDSMCEKHVSPGRRGVPDRILLYRGFVFFIETKAPKGTVKKHQARDHELRRRCGILVVCLYTVEQVDSFVGSLSLL